MDAAPLPSEVARDSSARDGEDRFVIPLEVWRASRDYKEFDVTATADLGWRAEILDATAPETARPLLTTGTPPDLPELLLVVTRDTAREPEVAGLLRVRVTFRDRAGALGDTALTFQFVDAGPVLVPISFEDYVLTLQDLLADDDTEAAASAAAGETVPGGALVAAPEDDPVTQGLLSTQILWGTVDFWDTRPRYSSTGSRHPTCDTSLYSCAPGTTDCCFSPLPFARISVDVRVQGGQWIHLFDAGLNSSGFYSGTTSSMPANTHDARITVIFDQTYPSGPNDFQLSVAPPTNTHEIERVLCIDNLVNDPVIPLGRFDLNPAWDTTSLNGDVAATWATMMDADARLAAEGETAQRGLGVARFQLTNGTNAQNCPKNGAPTQYVPMGEARSFFPARAMGLRLQSMAVGCNPMTSWPVFPVYDLSVQFAVDDDRFDSDTGEGVALVEAINELVVLLTWWDPATTTWPTLVATHHYKCIKNSPTAGYCNFKGQWVVTGTDGKSNSNNLSSYLNNAFALWNLIDSSSANTYYCKSDTVDLTVHDLIVALQAWQAGPQNGQNGDADEMSLINPAGYCTSSAECSADEVCAGQVTDSCYSGDPHGSNLRDWIRYLPSGVQSAAVSSIISQECVGIEDNSYPFRGGYHGD